MGRHLSEAPIATAFAEMRGADGTGDDYMERLGALPLAFAPGERWVYHTPSMVAGVLIERASGMAVGEFFRTRIFEPLGMPDTSFWVPADKRARLASYYRGGDDPARWCRSRATPCATPRRRSSLGRRGLVSTVDDYLRFGRMLLGRGEVDGVRLLSAASVDAMLTDQLPEGPERRFFLFDEFWRGAGFGLGLQVTTEQQGVGPAPGSFWWHGATGRAVDGRSAERSDLHPLHPARRFPARLRRRVRTGAIRGDRGLTARGAPTGGCALTAVAGAATVAWREDLCPVSADSSSVRSRPPCWRSTVGAPAQTQIHTQPFRDVPVARPRGDSVTPAFEGGIRTPTARSTWSWGYMNRNYEERIDIPVGPANRLEPGPPDQGQPTHFLPRRQTGVFTVTVPADFGDRTLTWTFDHQGRDGLRARPPATGMAD